MAYAPNSASRINANRVTTYDPYSDSTEQVEPGERDRHFLNMSGWVAFNQDRVVFYDQ